MRKTLQLQERKPARHVYELTDVGRELLHDMLAELPRELAGSEEEFLTRVGLFDELTTEERRNTLAARDDALKARAEHFAELAERAAASENVHEWGNAVMAELRARVVPPIGACVSWALRREHPAIELTLLRHKDSALSVSLSLLSAVVTFGTLFLMPIFAQSVQGHSAFATGLALLPQGVLTGLGTVLGERLLSRITLRTLVFFGFLLLVASSLTLLLLDQNTPLWATSVILSGRVVSIGFVVNPLLFGMLQPLRDTELADGTTLFTIMQRLGGSIGVGLLSSFLTARMLSGGPVHGIHDIGLLLTGLAALASLGLPGVRQATA